MTGAAAQHEAVSDGIVIGYAPRHVKNDAEQKNDGARREFQRQLIDHDQRQRLETVRDSELKDNARQREAPDHHHQPGRQRRLQPHQQKQRIDASDQQIDSA